MVITDDVFDVVNVLLERSLEAAVRREAVAISRGAAAISRIAATVSHRAAAVSRGAAGGALVEISLM